MSVIITGATVICSLTVRNSTGALVDPATSIQIQIERHTPTYLSMLAYTGMTKDSVGLYHYDYATSGLTKGIYIVTYKTVNVSRTSYCIDTFTIE
jgi:hypothetical protein